MRARGLQQFSSTLLVEMGMMDDNYRHKLKIYLVHSVLVFYTNLQISGLICTSSTCAVTVYKSASHAAYIIHTRFCSLLY